MDLSEQLQTSLGDTYTIERELGGGGMARVFLAEERRFGRKVVIKVLPPDITGAISVERFEREIQLAARLQHPHIVPVLAAGEADGLLFYTMPFVQGESLRDRIAREGRVPLADALRIAAEVASALACAHCDGVVHRDIKPENILMSSGHAMVADFGIAKAISLSATVAAGLGVNVGLTQLGTSLGTPTYMSPEQAAGETDLDGRSDIYSLGCVLYEMLAGRPPFTGPTAAAVIAKRFMETPAPLRSVDRSIPAAVEQIVSRAMGRDPADRFMTADELHRALTDAPQARSGPPVTADVKPSLAVLPFTNLGADSDDEYFSDGMTEEVINAIAHLQGIRVAARTSSFVFKGRREDLRSIAEQLRVETILEGSVRRAGSRVRISVQLIGATDGLHLWSERYDGDLADVFALQDRIAQAIAGALQERFSGVGAGKANALPENVRTPRERDAVDPAAYDLYLRGRFLFEQHAAIDAIACFERVVAMDPDFALAHAWLALTTMLAANLGLLSPLAAYPSGRVAADRALELEPRLPEAVLARGIVALLFDWDRPRGEALFREVLTLAPSWPHAHEFFGWALLSGDRVGEGIQALERAYALDPLSDFMLYNLALALVLTGDGRRAIEVLAPALARSPGNGALQLLMGSALYLAGELTEARATLERARELTPAGAQLRGTLVRVLAEMDDDETARARLAEIEGAARHGQAAVEAAVGHHALGDATSALAWLERACEARAPWMTWLHLDPRFAGLRSDPRFEALIRRVGVAPRQS